RPPRAIANTAPGISRRATSAWIAADSRSSRADDNPTCSGHSARGRPNVVILAPSVACLIRDACGSCLRKSLDYEGGVVRIEIFFPAFHPQDCVRDRPAW